VGDWDHRVVRKGVSGRAGRKEVDGLWGGKDEERPVHCSTGEGDRKKPWGVKIDVGGPVWGGGISTGKSRGRMVGRRLEVKEKSREGTGKEKTSLGRTRRRGDEESMLSEIHNEKRLGGGGGGYSEGGGVVYNLSLREGGSRP